MNRGFQSLLPGLNHHPNHNIAVKQMNGFGGMLSFELVPEIDSKNSFLI